MRKIASFTLFLLISLFYLPPVSAQTSLEGTYQVLGTNPGGKGSYRGVAHIVRAGESYRIHWSVGTVYDGVGKLNGKVFQVEWGTTTEHVGTVTYALQEDGSLKGTWFVAKRPNDLGTEVLIPKR